MLARAAAVWLCIVPAAIVNGILRDAVLMPYLGDPVARAISCITLAVVVLFIAWLSIEWIAPLTARAAWAIGALWLGLTLAFEFLAGHYVFGTSWAALRQDYNVAEGRLWVLVLAATLAAPPVVFLRASPRVHRLLRAGAATVLALISLSTAPMGAVLTGDDGRLDAATAVLRRAMGQGSAAIPLSIMLRAHGIAVFPQSAREGNRYRGTGFMSARGASPAAWTPPAAIALEGVIPIELESEAADFVLIAQTQRGLDYLVQPRFASPVAPPIVAGTMGADARARGDADLVAYIQFGDYFAGVTIEAWSVRELTAANAILYGRPYSTDAIVRGAGFFHLSPAARAWRAALAACFRELS